MDHIGARELRRSSAALCFCVCAAVLVGEDLLQHSYRRDRAVLAHIATHLRPPPRHVARVVAAPEHVVARDLDRLIDDGLGVLVTDGATPSSDRTGGPPEFCPPVIVREFPCGDAQHRPRSPVGRTGDRDDH